MPTTPTCRLCDTPLRRTFVDLGMSPLCESYVAADALDEPEVFYPLHVRVCERCLLVQLPAYVPAEQIFADYAYFSSYSDSWVAHAARYADAMTSRLDLNEDSLVTEVASNDGYLLQHFARRNINVLGIEPAKNIVAHAQLKGIRTIAGFLGPQTGERIAREHGRADLVVANNVFAHVPDIRGFAKGLSALVKDDGLITLEFPHLQSLIEGRQYDTICHEHYSYLTLLTATRALGTAGLNVTDVEKLGTHGGSLRVYARKGAPSPSDNVRRVRAEEQAAGLHTIAGYGGFAAAVTRIKTDLLRFLIDAAARGQRVAGYGAPGKGNTLLNHCGIRSDLLAFTVDGNPVKQGKFLPGTRIPIYPPDHLAAANPDYVLVLPWHLRDEIAGQLTQFSGRLVFPIPELEIV